MDLTTGSISKKLFRFSIPLVLTNIMQVLFNMTDLAVVGRFSGPLALGAVGSTPMLLFLFTGLLIGLGGGVNAICAFYIGAKSKKDLSETIHTAAVICLAFGFILMGMGWIFGRPILELMNTKPELIDGADLYFKLYMLEMPAGAIYNFGNGVLSAAGDTKRPLYFLTFSGVINVILNLVFVIGFGMSVDGVAIASVIASSISAALILITLLRGEGEIKLELKKLGINWNKAARILKIGLPAALQNVIFAFANLFMQMGLNSFDAIMVSGNSAASNADALIYNIMAAFNVGCATFIGQNFGANNRRRVVQSFWWSQLYSFGAGLVLGTLLFIFGRQFLLLFTTDEAVIQCGLLRIQVMAFSYCISACMDNPISACRGLGKTLVPSVLVSFGSCAFRILWIFTIFAHFKTIMTLFLLFPASWILTGVCTFVYFLMVLKKSFSN